MASELFANASLYTPPEPEALAKLDINEHIIAGLILRLMHISGSMVAHEIAAEVCLPFFNVVEPILNTLRDNRMLEITRGEMAAVSYVYSITDSGRARALQYFEQTTYIGPAPVSVATYNQVISEQSLRHITVHADRLHEAFRGLVFDETILDQVGPAVNSGRSIFLYGPSGNGKTAICERIVKSFGGSLFIPYALEVNGSIIKVFDEYNHKTVPPKSDTRLQGKYDRRFRLIERPVIIVGGELTMDSLDLIWNEESRYYEAPFQLKANGGALMVDDFGRQRIDPKTLLNRWIVPLEKQVDFLTLHTGTKIEIPFDELIVFSTNLNPRDLVDDAFSAADSLQDSDQRPDARKLPGNLEDCQRDQGCALCGRGGRLFCGEAHADERAAVAGLPSPRHPRQHSRCLPLSPNRAHGNGGDAGRGSGQLLREIRRQELLENLGCW